MEKESKSEKPKKPTKPKSKVPEMAENMEHTLRRLVKAKNAARSKSPVQYLHK